MNPFIGLIYIFKGFNLIRRPGLRRFVLIPLLVNIILFAGGIWLAGSYFAGLMAILLPQGFGWLEWLLWPIFGLALLLTMFYSFTLIANFICAPFNGLLAEAVELELKGEIESSDISLMQALKDTPKSLWSEVRKLGYFLSRAIPLLILFLIPVLNIAAPFLWIAFSAALLAREYFDYPMANHGQNFQQQRQILKQHRFSSLSFGAGIMFLTMIPVVNFIVMPLAVAGATAMYLERIRKS